MKIVVIDSRHGVRLSDEMTKEMEDAEWTVIIEADGNARVVPHENNAIDGLQRVKAVFFTAITEEEANRANSLRNTAVFEEKVTRSGHNNEQALARARAVWDR